MSILRIVASLSCAAILAVAQNPQSTAISPAQVTETLNALASDAMAGRDTPSPEQEKAALYIANRMKAAGLKPGGSKNSYFHIYERDGVEWDSNAVRLSANSGSKSVQLKGGRDVRLWRASGAVTLEGAEAVRLVAETSGAKGLSAGRRSRRPLLLEVSEDSPLWKSRAGKWQKMKSRFRTRGAPWLLVRKGLLPEGELQVDLTLPAPKSIKLKLKNVVGILPGSSKKKELVLVSAHYDHIGIGINSGGDFINNGADDDASGTTAVILLADALRERKAAPARSVAFVCFSGEEKGLLGSAGFANDPPFPLKQIAVNINIEMIGRPKDGAEGQAWVTGRGYSEFESIMEEGLKQAGVKMTTFSMGNQLFRASDNYSLAKHGVVAHSISAGYMHPDYHRPTDEVERINVNHMAKIIEGIYHGMILFADRAKRPAYNEAGKKALASRRGRR